MKLPSVVRRGQGRIRYATLAPNLSTFNLDRGLYGARPDFEFVEILALIENARP
jgi:hypothetical protein